MNRLPKTALELPDPLGAYRAKRDFALTPEPATGGQSVADQLRFVVQKYPLSALCRERRFQPTLLHR